jgi:hypothetical protein
MSNLCSISGHVVQLATTRPTGVPRPKPITENPETSYAIDNDAPLIDESDSARGRVATKDGDECAGARVAIRSRTSLARRIEWREQ